MGFAGFVNCGNEWACGPTNVENYLHLTHHCDLPHLSTSSREQVSANDAYGHYLFRCLKLLPQFLLETLTRCLPVFTEDYPVIV
jgi:hypothetical protein